MKNYYFIFFLAILMMVFRESKGQESTLQDLPLNDLSSFRPQAGNWMIVGDVMIEPNVDIHHEAHVEPASTKKKKKKGVEEPKPVLKAVSYTEGKGILLNINDELKKDHLVTASEHGDIQLELEVMLPKGSNSGIYLQGRYEIQLLDSWGSKNPRYSDIGGIYRNWETEPGKTYMGKAPLYNAAKAPGLWQKIELLFKAPRFDESGKKIENAKFVYVDLNGVRIHDNIEVPLPTGGPIENNEVARGPIMIQGDHGPVAIRNIRYKLMNESGVSLSMLNYKAYLGEFKDLGDFYGTKPATTGASGLSCFAAGANDEFGLVFEGTIHIPATDKYSFLISGNGGARLSINGQVLADIQRADGSGWIQKEIALEEGEHFIEVVYFKNALWMQPKLGLFVETNTTYSKTLHTFDSYPIDINNVSQVIVQVGNKPKLLRAFIDFKGDEDRRITHSIGVADPSGVNYVYDLKNGNLVCVWKGEFVNATPMWHDRGDGSFDPIGAVEYLVNNQQLAIVKDEVSPFPVKSDEKEFKPKGYIIDEQSERPVFLYHYQGAEVEDRIYPTDNGKTITREINFNKTLESEHLMFKLAEGSDIKTLTDGTFVINDRQYYLKILKGGQPAIREVNGLKELVIPVQGSQIKYSVIW